MIAHLILCEFSTSFKEYFHKKKSTKQLQGSFWRLCCNLLPTSLCMEWTAANKSGQSFWQVKRSRSARFFWKDSDVASEESAATSYDSQCMEWTTANKSGPSFWQVKRKMLHFLEKDCCTKNKIEVLLKQAKHNDNVWRLQNTGKKSCLI